MAFFRSRRRLRAVVLMLLVVGIGYWVWRGKHPKRENPTLAGVPLEERLKGLNGKDVTTQKRTLRTLAAFGPKARGALPEVIAAADDREVSDDALLALGRMREDALPTLTAWLKAEKPKPETKDESKAREREHRRFQKQAQAATALGYAGPGAIPLLREHLSDQHEFVYRAVRQSLVQIAGEHPETIPELATELRSMVFVGESTHLQENFRVAARDPKVFAIWTNLLRHPDIETRRFAFAALLNFYQHDPSRGDHYFFDPELIAVLASVVTGAENERDEIERNPVPGVLLRLHARGHPVIPALLAEFRAILTDSPTETRSPRATRRAGIVSVLTRLGPDADRVVPEFVALLKSAPPEALYSVVQFLSAYEKRCAQRELLAVVGGGAVVAGFPPSVLRELVTAATANPDGRGGVSNLYPDALAAHFDRAVPHIVAELAAGNADRRNDLLRVVQGTAAVRRPQRDQPYPPVPLALVHAVADCLAEPATRENATRCLGAFGPYGTSALPELLLVLDERNFETVTNAVREIRQPKFDRDGSLRLTVPLAPDIGGRLAAARRAFQKNPNREILSARLARSHDGFEDPDPRPLMRLLLEPAADRLTPQILAALHWSDVLCDFCGGDPTLFRLLLDLPLFRYFTGKADVFIAQHHRDELPATTQAVLRCVRRGDLEAARALPAIYPNETPEGVAELLFGLLDKAKPDESLEPVLWALLKLQPLPGKWVVPEAVRKRGSPSQRLVAAVVLRWNPDDARAADALLAGFVPALFVPARSSYSCEAAELIAPRAATDKRALTAVLTLIASMERDWWAPGSNGERQFELLYRAVRSAGPLGTERAVQTYLAANGNWALRRLIDRLIADGATTPHAIFLEAKAANKPVKLLFEFVSGETIDEAMQLQRANPGERLPLVSGSDALRFPKVFPTLKVWLSGENAQLRSHAFQVLSVTHPADPDVWAAAENGYAFGSPILNLPPGPWAAHQPGISSDAAFKHLRKHPERAIPVVRAWVCLLPGDYWYADDMFSLFRFYASRAVNETYLTDPEPVVRRIALNALGARLSHEAGVRSEAPLSLRAVDDLFTPAVLQTFAKFLSDPDARVRAAAQDWITDNHNRYQRTPGAGTPLSILPPDAIRPYLAVLRERLAAKPKGKVDWRAVDHARWLVYQLEFCDSPDQRGLRDELAKVLPGATEQKLAQFVEEIVRDEQARLRPGTAPRRPARAAEPERFGDLPSPILLTRFLDEATGRRSLELFFETRAELLRRAKTDPAIAEQLFTAYLEGNFQPRHGPSTTPVILRELAPLAVPTLLKHLDQMDRKPGHVGFESRVIDLIGDLGPQTRDAVPLLLAFAADKSVPRRLAARRALQKIAPDVFAELD